MHDVPLPRETIAETLTCAWEYSRCIIPHYTNWPRYVAFARTIAVGILAEVHGHLVDVLASDRVLGYDVAAQLDILFGGTVGREAMGREYRAFLLASADKCSVRRDGEFFRKYVDALASGPKNWFRLRDCDALARFTMAAALACNDFDDFWFEEEEWQVLAELGDTLYDAVAFHKHRAEGETHSTFSYVGGELRPEAFRRCRELLWALDVVWAQSPPHRCVLNFLRPFGGPIHIMMRRYRFVEDNLTVGKPETEEVVVQTRENFKLWHRVDATEQYVQNTRCEEILAQKDRLLFSGFAEMLQKGEEGRCPKCRHRLSYGAQASGQFGGVQLCDGCKGQWQGYLDSLPERAAQVFPALQSVLSACRVGYPRVGSDVRVVVDSGQCS
jgi:hypothetical protein